MGGEAEVRSQIRSLEEIGITDLVVAANGSEDEVRRTVDLASMLAREES